MSYLDHSFRGAVKKTALGIAFSSIASIAFAWSISGNVADEAGSPLAGVSIASFNYAGITGISDAAGAFSINSETTSLFGIAQKKVSVQRVNNLLSISNTSGAAVEVTLMDALGKVNLQQEFNSANIQIDLAKLGGQKMMILRVSTRNSSENYIVSQKGINNILKKEGDPMATLSFTLDGFDMATYTMTAENETGVKIVMKKASQGNSDGTPIAGSSGNEAGTENSGNGTVAASSSSAESNAGLSSGGQSSANQSSADATPSSSSTPAITSCTGKTLTTSQTITVDGRTVIVKFPSGYDGTKPAPLVVNYHPISGSASAWSTSSQVAQAALADGAIVIFPDGEESPNFGKAWNIGPCCTDADDITFTKDFIAELEEKSCVDNKRIYAAGFSMGGGMSNYIGCKMSDVFAAAAPSAMDLSEELVTQGNYGGCHPSRPFPILNFRGTSDFVVSYEGAYSSLVTGKAMTFLGAKKNLETWKTLNGCTGTAKSDTPYSGCEMYENCSNGVKTGLCTIQGGGHAEGDGTQGWNFLKQWELP